MKTLKRFAPTVALMVVISYLGYHALHGEQGYRNYLVTQQRIADTQSELARAHREREHLEDRVARLSPDQGQLDLDYLAERSRAVLNFAHPDEVIVRIEPQGARF